MSVIWLKYFDQTKHLQINTSKIMPFHSNNSICQNPRRHHLPLTAVDT